LLEFSGNHEEVILKSLACGFISYGGKNLKFYTRRMDGSLKQNIGLVEKGPVICQKFIRKRYEIRVTVVGVEAFPVAIDYSKLPDVTDYRTVDFAEFKDAFGPCSPELSSDISKLSVELAKRFGIRLAGLDWILDEGLAPYFLEINPTPSFKWYELSGAGNITRAIANLLTSEKS
jgi:glutathione synthase/RimK-type ligase-like ATP-grasp enzyme